MMNASGRREEVEPGAPPSPPAAGKGPRLLVALLLIGVTLAVFGPARDYDFVGWDDDIHVYANPRLSSPQLADVLYFWKGPHVSLYMPATWSSWWLLARLSGMLHGEGSGFDPRVFHCANLILHTVNVLLVFMILERLFTGTRAVSSIRLTGAAGIGALLFAVHPLQVEPVVWVSSMKDLLCGLFSLLALRQYLLYSEGCAVRRPRREEERRTGTRYAILATTAFLLALLSKPSAVPLPLVAWLMVHFRYRNADFGAIAGKAGALLRKPHMLLLSWILLALPFGIMSKLAQRDINLTFTAPLWARVPLACDALAFYLGRLILPLRLGIDYGRTPALVMEDEWFRYAWMIPCCLALVFLLLPYRRQWLASLGIFAAGALPTLGLVPYGYQVFSTVADRYLYLSMLGPALALGWLFLAYRKRIVVLLCSLIICCFSALSLAQRNYWSNNKALFLHALEINDRSYMAHYNLGMTLDGDGRPTEAIRHYEKALEIKPDYGRAHNNLGAALTRRGRLREAIPHFAEALRIEPGNEGAYYNLYVGHNVLGVELAEKGDLDGAIEHFTEALRLKPDYAEAGGNLNQALQRAGKK